MVCLGRLYRPDELQVMAGIAVQDAARYGNAVYADNEDMDYRGVPSRELSTGAGVATVESYADADAQTVRMRIFWCVGDADGVAEKIVHMSGEYRAEYGYDTAFEPVVGALVAIVADGVAPSV